MLDEVVISPMLHKVTGVGFVRASSGKAFEIK